MKCLASILVITGLILTGCMENGTNDPEPVQLEDFSKTWIMKKVTYQQSEDRTKDWADFTITFSGTKYLTGSKTYITTHAFSPGPWPVNGTVVFGSNGEKIEVNKLIRDDGLEIALTLSGDSLTMVFTYFSNIDYRLNSKPVNGEYIFEMKAQ